jgi:hypothetical protein
LVTPERRATLIAQRSGESAGNSRESILAWNVVMQGDGETVFFDY